MGNDQENFINELTINNFKSIKDLQIEPERINVFVGRPNVGKSNILEALSLLGGNYSKAQLADLVRYQNLSNLFYDQNRKVAARVETQNQWCTVTYDYDKKDYLYTFSSINDLFNLGLQGDQELDNSGNNVEGKDVENQDIGFNWNIGKGEMGGNINFYAKVKKYEFNKGNSFEGEFPDFLMPPYGKNLVAVLENFPEIHETVAQFFEEFGLELVVDTSENKLEIQKKVKNLVYKVPYGLIADTLQRIIFYVVAIQSNKDSVLIFEEPEAHAYPAYVQFLADEIGQDKANQYFMTTHNPYFIETLLEGNYRDEVGIFLTYYEDYETKVKKLSEAEIDNILYNDADLFFNLKAFRE